MEAPLTPTSALLYAYLDLDAFDTPRLVTTSKDALDDDVFAHAFGEHEKQPHGQEPFKQIPFPTQTYSIYQSIYNSPPSSVDAASDSPSESLSSALQNATNPQAQDPAVLSQIPSYLAHVLSTQTPDDFISFGQKDLGTAAQRFLPALTEEKENQVQQVPFTDNFPDPFAGQHEEPSARSASPSSKMSLPDNTSQPPKVKKTRKRRNDRTAEEEATRHQAFLERNRKAAGKCRSRKKDRVQRLVEDVDLARARNSELRALHAELLAEVDGLRAAMAMNCGCGAEHLQASMEDLDGMAAGKDGALSLSRKERTSSVLSAGSSDTLLDGGPSLASSVSSPHDLLDDMDVNMEMDMLDGCQDGSMDEILEDV